MFFPTYLRLHCGDFTVPTPLRYTTQIEANSLANTPPTFGIYMFDLVLDWIKGQGGLSVINEINKKLIDFIFCAQIPTSY